MADKTILLVEDNPDDIELTKYAIEKNNLKNEIISVCDGAEALEYLFGTGRYSGRDVSVMPAVILLDLNLPKIDGHEVLRRIRANDLTKLIPVIVLTSSKEVEDVANCYRLGVNSYVRKPVDFNQFIDAVKYLGMYWLQINESLYTREKK